MGAVCIVFLDFSGNWTGDDGWHGFIEPKIGGAFPVFWLVFLAAMGVSALLYFMTDNESVPRFHIVLVLLGFVATVAWLDLIGNECVAILEALGNISTISKSKSGHSIIGVTVLSWANSIGDFVADTAVARAGQPKMGVASVFGSPLLTCCLGLALSSMIASFKTGSVTTNLNSEIMLSFIFIGISLLSSLGVIVYNNFTIPRFYAFYLWGVYCLYMVFTLIIQLAHWRFCPERVCPEDS